MKNVCKNLKAEVEMLRLIWHHAKGQHVKLTIGLVVEMLLGLFMPSVLYLLQKVVGIKATNIEALLTKENLIFLIIIYFIYLILKKVSRVLTAYAVAEVDYSLRTHFGSALRSMPYEYFNSNIGIQFSNGLTQEISMASDLIPILYRSFIRSGCTILAFGVLLIIISPHFFLMSLVLIAVVLLSVLTLRNSIKKIHYDLFNRISSLYQLFSEWINGYRVFRVFGCMDFAIGRMQEVFLAIRNISRRLTIFANGQTILAEMLTYSIAALIVVMMPTNNGIIEFGVIISYPVAILLIRDECMNLISGYQKLANTESSIKRLLQIIGSNYAECKNMRKVDNVQAIVFNEVSFSYNSESSRHEILNKATLKCEKGMLHVITGPSGIGKTTTLNILLGLLQPENGEIQIIEDHQQRVREGMVIVEQEPFLFEGSLYDNICMGRNIPIGEVTRWIDLLHMSDLFPTHESILKKEQMVCRKLSSGEKQRIALIRALVGNPSVLIADEVTSNIDIATSRLITNVLRDMSIQMLIIVVSHDPLLIENADMRHFLHNKKIISEYVKPSFN